MRSVPLLFALSTAALLGAIIYDRVAFTYRPELRGPLGARRLALRVGLLVIAVITGWLTFH